MPQKALAQARKDRGELPGFHAQAVLVLQGVLYSFERARVAELADALDSKSSDRKVVMVRLHSRAPLLQPLLRCIQ